MTAAAAALVVGHAVSAQKPRRDVPVALAIADASDGISSDGLGPYQDGADAIQAVLRSGENLNVVFGTRKAASSRQICFNFSNPIVGDDLGPFECRTIGQLLTGGGGTLAAMNAGDIVHKLMSISWPETTTMNYSMRWGGDLDANGQEDSDWVAVECTADDSDGCSSWTVTPVGGQVARLYSKTGRGSFVFVGDYVMPLEFTVTRQ